LNILLAADGSEFTKKAIEYVAAHPGLLQNDAKLHVLHVEPQVSSNRARAVLGSDVVDNYYKEESQAALGMAEKILHEKGIPFHSSYLIGDVAERIKDYVEINGIGMVVMGSHGNGALRNLVMGSVATKVLATTTVPVLLIR
jgi:nucleotide-binding universal stress UspA family protein